MYVSIILAQFLTKKTPWCVTSFKEKQGGWHRNNREDLVSILLLKIVTSLSKSDFFFFLCCMLTGEYADTVPKISLSEYDPKRLHTMRKETVHFRPSPARASLQWWEVSNSINSSLKSSAVSNICWKNKSINSCCLHTEWGHGWGYLCKSSP